MTGRPDPAGTPTIDVIEADRRRRAPGDGPRPLLVDVRELDEVVAVRAEDVVVIPMSQFAQRFRELPDDQPLMIICASGGRSAMAAAFLAANGYRDAVNVAGGRTPGSATGCPSGAARWHPARAIRRPAEGPRPRGEPDQRRRRRITRPSISRDRSLWANAQPMSRSRMKSTVPTPAAFR